MELFLSGCASEISPAESVFTILECKNGDYYEVPRCLPFKNGWGIVALQYLSERKEYPLPTKLDSMWLSVVEHKIYSVAEEIEKSVICDFISEYNPTQINLIVGFGPFGKLVIWINIHKKSIVLKDCIGQEIQLQSDIYPLSITKQTISQYCISCIESDEKLNIQLKENGLPAKDLFDNYMKQFTYRYQVMMEKWRGEDEDVKWERYKEDEEKVPEFDWIEEALYDGTHDKLHDGGLMNYHQAGKPKKLAIQFHQGKTEYTAYFWFDEIKIREVFDRFYGAHPETKTDFIIRIDAERKKHELALYRYGLKEPVILKDDVYQLIVFKNKFEDYRSDNYDQPRGAWIW